MTRRLLCVLFGISAIALSACAGSPTTPSQTSASSTTSATATSQVQVLGSCSLAVAPVPGQTRQTRTLTRSVSPGTQIAFGPPMSAALSSNVAGIWSATASVENIQVTSFGNLVTTGNAAATNSANGVGRCWTGQPGQEFTLWLSVPAGPGPDQVVSVTVTSPVAP